MYIYYIKKKMNNQILLLIIIILIVYLVKNRKNEKEQFRLFYESSPSTRNMSYDLRCEPKIPKLDFSFKNSSIQPYYREKCLVLK